MHFKKRSTAPSLQRVLQRKYSDLCTQHVNSSDLVEPSTAMVCLMSEQFAACENKTLQQAPVLLGSRVDFVFRNLGDFREKFLGADRVHVSDCVITSVPCVVAISPYHSELYNQWSSADDLESLCKTYTAKLQKIYLKVQTVCCCLIALRHFKVVVVDGEGFKLQNNWFRSLKHMIGSVSLLGETDNSVANLPVQLWYILSVCVESMKDSVETFGEEETTRTWLVILLEKWVAIRDDTKTRHGYVFPVDSQLKQDLWDDLFARCEKVFDLRISPAFKMGSSKRRASGLKTPSRGVEPPEVGACLSHCTNGHLGGTAVTSGPCHWFCGLSLSSLYEEIVGTLENRLRVLELQTRKPVGNSISGFAFTP
jgi:hypothetical protein